LKEKQSVVTHIPHFNKYYAKTTFMGNSKQ